jgi:hypothetical protein
LLGNFQILRFFGEQLFQDSIGKGSAGGAISSPPIAMFLQGRPAALRRSMSAP